MLVPRRAGCWERSTEGMVMGTLPGGKQPPPALSALLCAHAMGMLYRHGAL